MNNGTDGKSLAQLLRRDSVRYRRLRGPGGVLGIAMVPGCEGGLQARATLRKLVPFSIELFRISVSFDYEVLTELVTLLRKNVFCLNFSPPIDCEITRA